VIENIHSLYDSINIYVYIKIFYILYVKKMQATIDNENVAIVFGSMALFVLLFRIFMFGIPLMKKSFREKSVKKFFQSLTLMC